MYSKKEWKAAAERHSAENRALRVLVNELEKILEKAVLEDLGQSKRRIRRALRKIAVAKGDKHGS